MLKIERTTIAAEELNYGGLVPNKYLNLTTLVSLIILLAVILVKAPLELSATNAILLASAVLSARLIAFDFCYFLLLNIYTLPLIILGLLFSYLEPNLSLTSSLYGVGVALGINIALILISLAFTRGKSGVGMGDLKFLLASGAFLGTEGLIISLMLATFISLPLSFITKKGDLPLGPGLIIAFWLTFLFKNDILGLLMAL